MIKVIIVVKNGVVQQTIVAQDGQCIEHESVVLDHDVQDLEAKNKNKQIEKEIKELTNKNKKIYNVINNFDGNGCFTIEASSLIEAYQMALDELGWWISDNKP